MIIIDLEWNSGIVSGKPFDEILEIGAAKVDFTIGKITDTFDVFIHPEIHAAISKTASDLPELEQSLASEVKFPEAIQRFLDWCGSETEFGAWGGCDLMILNRSMKRCGMEGKLDGQCFDIQRSFSRIVGTNWSVALHRAVEYCRIPDTFTFHNALADSVYTALIALDIGDAEIHKPKETVKKPQTKQWKKPRNKLQNSYICRIRGR